MTRAAACAALTIASLTSSYAQPAPTAPALQLGEPVESEIGTPADKVDQLMSRWSLGESPGAAVGVVHHGKVVLARGYGLADLEHRVPITPSTVFDIASVSKQFTGLAVAMLIREGKLSLLDDYRKHLPEMPDYGPTITIEHLLHHTSGIRDFPATLGVAGWQEGDVVSFDQILTLARNLRQLNFVPGDENVYSNTNYNLLAETVARVTGQSFQDWTLQNLFEPLGMDSTHFQHDETTVIPNRAYGYRRGPDGRFRHTPNNLTAMGSSSLFSTVEDLARWAINFDTKEVGGAEAIELMHQPGALNDGSTVSYAFGVSTGRYRGLPIVSHTGSWASFATILIRFPEQQLTIIVLANTPAVAPDEAAFQIAQIYLEKELAAARAATGEPTTAPTVEAFEIDPERLHDYVGPYELEGTLFILIERNDDRLLARPRGQPTVELVPRGEDAFAVPAADAEVFFRRDDQNAVVGFVLHQPGGTAEGKRIEPPETFALNATELEEYAGRYWSSELEVFYDFVVTADRLEARHRRHGVIGMTPTQTDAFAGGRYLPTVVFSRDANGEIDGLSVSAGPRARNLAFEKIVQ